MTTLSATREEDNGTCFVCHRSTSKLDRLSSRRVRFQDLLGQMKYILRDDNLFSTSDLHQIFICAKCFRRVESTRNFMIVLREAYDRYNGVDSSVWLDRIANTSAPIIREANSSAQINSEANSSAHNNREANSSAHNNREANSSAHNNREANSSAHNNREANSSAHNNREANSSAHNNRKANLSAHNKRETDSYTQSSDIDHVFVVGPHGLKREAKSSLKKPDSYSNIIPVPGNSKKTKRQKILESAGIKIPSADYLVRQDKKVKNCGTLFLSDHDYFDCNESEMTSITSCLSDIQDEYSKLKEEDWFNELMIQTSCLTSKTDLFSSVLYRLRDVKLLQENADSLLPKIVMEMKERVPLLFKVMLCAATPGTGKLKESIVSTLASAYSILMKHNYDNLSAYHRLVTAITFKGGLDEKGHTSLNHLGLIQSWTGMRALLETMGKSVNSQIVNTLKENPLINITAMSYNIDIGTSMLNRKRINEDLHIFTSCLIFSRVAQPDIDNTVPSADLTTLNYNSIAMNDQEKAKFLEAYRVLLARVLCHLPSFWQYSKLVPEHIPHEYSDRMAARSDTFQLPVMLKNEAEHEDCIAIFDGLEEQLTGLYTNAFGDPGNLRKFGVPVSGDQWMRTQLHGAKAKHNSAIAPLMKYEDIHPIVCQMGHIKEDFLQMCFKTLYKIERSPGTLFHFKSLLHRTEIFGTVKGKFKLHNDFLTLVGECMLEEQFTEFIESTASKLSEEMMGKSEEEQKSMLMETVEKFMGHYGYGMVDQSKTSEYNITHLIDIDGDNIHIPMALQTQSEPDELYNYSVQLCHWFLHFNEMQDTTKEGDLDRTLLNCQYSLPFFYSHSKMSTGNSSLNENERIADSKYMMESIELLIKCKYELSPLQKIRVLEGCYVNIEGGKGQNVDSDYTHEQSVCNQKTLIKSLGENLSEAAIIRITSAADSVVDICAKVDKCMNIKNEIRRSKPTINQEDRDKILKILRDLRPFRFTPGRKCRGFKGIQCVPVPLEKNIEMRDAITEMIGVHARGFDWTIQDPPISDLFSETIFSSLNT